MTFDPRRGRWHDRQDAQTSERKHWNFERFSPLRELRHRQRQCLNTTNSWHQTNLNLKHCGCVRISIMFECFPFWLKGWNNHEKLNSDGHVHSYSKTILSIQVDWIKKFNKYLNFFSISEGILAELARIITHFMFTGSARVNDWFGNQWSKSHLTILRDSIKDDLELMAHEVCERDGCGHVKPIFCNKRVMPNFVKIVLIISKPRRQGGSLEIDLKNYWYLTWSSFWLLYLSLHNLKDLYPKRLKSNLLKEFL